MIDAVFKYRTLLQWLACVVVSLLNTLAGVTLKTNRHCSVPLDLQSKGIELGVYNPVSSFGSQTLTLDNFGLQIRNDRVFLSYPLTVQLIVLCPVGCKHPKKYPF